MELCMNMSRRVWPKNMHSVAKIVPICICEAIKKRENRAVIIMWCKYPNVWFNLIRLIVYWQIDIHCRERTRWTGQQVPRSQWTRHNIHMCLYRKKRDDPNEWHLIPVIYDNVAHSLKRKTNISNKHSSNAGYT